MTTTIAKRQNVSPSATFGDVVDNIFQNSLRHFFSDHSWNNDFGVTSGSVPVNVRELENEYCIDVIAPGLRKEDFNLNIEGNLLNISYDHKERHDEQNQKSGWSRSEFVLRSFSRSFMLDDSVDLNNVQATYDKGILRLHLPKTEKAKRISQKIEVK